MYRLVNGQKIKNLRFSNPNEEGWTHSQFFVNFTKKTVSFVVCLQY